MDEIKTKQQVVEKIKESSKILVTVSDNPSVDALSAALALTMVLDKQEKYGTAIFSGETPPAIAFLEPEKTFDDTTDSLRDFIIALNKEKADHLRYKIEGESVKIFITPYKTTITQDDLEFSQGDYNVELVIALGVDAQENLDRALENHGQILHDAAIITMTAGDQTSDLGGIDWHDANSSSLSEMVAGLAEALKEDKKKSLIDAPIATALLTGIVAETDRFSNEHTTSKAMTVAAALMAAGADQQLIATELQASHEINSGTNNDAATDALDHAASSGATDASDSNVSSDGSLTIERTRDNTALAITHEDETLADLDRRVRGDEKARARVIEEVAAAEAKAAKEETAGGDAQSTASATGSTETPQLSAAYQADDEATEPILGGTLNATTDQAEEDARREAASDQNKTILSHSYLGGDPASEGGVDTASSEVVTTRSNALAGTTPEGFPGTPPAAPGSVGVNDLPSSDEVHSAYALEEEVMPATDTQAAPLGISGERVIEPIDPATSVTAPVTTPEAPAAVAPAATPADLGLPLPPPIPDFSALNGAPAPAIPLPPAPQPAILGDILAPEPASAAAPVLPPDPALFMNANAVPAPDSAYAPEDTAPVLPPLAPAPEAVAEPVAPAPAPTAAPVVSDPGQFQIPPAH